MAVKLGQLVLDVRADTQHLIKGMNKANTAVKKFATLAKQLIAGAALATAFKSATTAGFKFNSEIEQSINGISSLIAATSKLEDSQGNSVTQQELLNMARKESIDIIDKLNKVNADTPHTLTQTQQIFKAMLPGMRALNVSYEDMVEITKKMSIASGAAGIQFQQLLAGVDGLASGAVASNSELGRFFRSLGLTNEALKKASQSAGGLEKLLNDKLSGFEAIETMATNTSNLEVAWSELTGTVTKASFEKTKGVMKDIADIMKDATKWVKEFNFWLKEADDFTMGNSIDEVEKKIQMLVSEYQVLEKTLDDPTLWDSISNSAVTATNMANIRDQIIVLDKLKSEIEGLSTALTVAKGVEFSVPEGTDIKFSKELEDYKNKLQNIKDVANGISNEMNNIIQQSQTIDFFEQSGMITPEEATQYFKAVGDAYVKQMEDANKKVKTDFEQIKDLIGTQLENSMTSTFRSWLDGTMEFKDLMLSTLKDIAAEMMRIMVFKNLAGGITGAMGFSSGGVASGGSVSAFATGGVVSSPTYFPMSSGTGLMGESGPEAIMPLTRIGGDLGVKVSGKSNNTTINVVNNGPDEVSVSESSGPSGKTIDILIERKVKETLGNGSMDRSMKANYGVRRQGS